MPIAVHTQRASRPGRTVLIGTERKELTTKQNQNVSSLQSLQKTNKEKNQTKQHKGGDDPQKGARKDNNAFVTKDSREKNLKQSASQCTHALMSRLSLQ
eukprot:1983266-Ditylum_brightwellii.AAC.1